jgi:hypothetical protein
LALGLNSISNSPIFKFEDLPAKVHFKFQLEQIKNKCTEENTSSCVFYVLHRQWLGIDWLENPPEYPLHGLRHLEDFPRSIGR